MRGSSNELLDSYRTESATLDWRDERPVDHWVAPSGGMKSRAERVSSESRSIRSQGGRTPTVRASSSVFWPACPNSKASECSTMPSDSFGRRIPARRPTCASRAGEAASQPAVRRSPAVPRVRGLRAPLASGEAVILGQAGRILGPDDLSGVKGALRARSHGRGSTGRPAPDRGLSSAGPCHSGWARVTLGRQPTPGFEVRGTDGGPQTGS